MSRLPIPKSLLAFASYLAFAMVFMRRLLPVWNHAIPGGLEDTRIFLWNAWWTHHALETGQNPFYTDLLFHPFGISLVSHDFPVWMNAVTEFAQRFGATLAGACNTWFILTWSLNGWAVFLLVREVTGRSWPAYVAGLYVMTHSYTLARAMQNWGQFNVFGIAVFLWLLVRARRTGARMDFVVAGFALAFTAACHYYFLIYSVLAWVAVAVRDIFDPRFSVRARDGRPWWRWVAIAMAALGGVMATVILVFHPSDLVIGGKTIGMKGAENSLMVFWIGVAILAASFVRWPLAFDKPAPQAIRGHAWLAFAAGIGLSPLVYGAIRLALQGGYPKQHILWKTHLAGANVWALVSPNALQAWWGPAVSQCYRSGGMDPQEQAASIGWTCLITIGVAQAWRKQVGARRWLALAAAATLFSMGIYLHIGAINTGCPLPFFALRLIPVVGNVRVPERWMAMGSIAWAVVLGLALMELSRKRKIGLPTLGLGVTFLLLLENWPGIPAAAMPLGSKAYERLREEPSGAVLPIPLYIGDSSIGTGDALPSKRSFPWDHLAAQIAHAKPMLGGFVGRVPRALIKQYQADPFINGLLKREEGEVFAQPSDPLAGRNAVDSFGIRYLLVYPSATRPAALAYALDSLPKRLLVKDGDVELYDVEPPMPFAYTR